MDEFEIPVPGVPYQWSVSEDQPPNDLGIYFPVTNMK